MTGSLNNNSTIQPTRTHLRLVRTLLALLFATGLSAWLQTGYAEFSGNYYQVEVLVFKRLNPEQSPERLDPGQPHYARNLFAIAPNQLSDTVPQLLSQTRDLESIVASVKPAQPQQQQFLFADKGSADFNRRQLERTKISQVKDQDQPKRQNDLDQRLAFIFSDQTQIYTSLPAASRVLNREASSIRRSQGFRLLSHNAWIQPIASANKAILIQAGEQYGEAFELDGTISLRVSRYLHVETDLWLTSFERIAPDQPLAQFPQQRGSSDKSYDESYDERYKKLLIAESRKNAFLAEQKFPLRQSRRMRSAETHYLDHHRFGIMVHIKPTQLGAEAG
ncbi:MAG: hypothetical protein HOL98_12840 [Gammaproteobacteria bacterium]|nr:hypothetical protein [Gammaproteobacteria bacterium]MBT5204335.1 hypothetical protein [Gammaproteobacteria bacterium]MBT5603331.1 hypothetical protein [Gammaproteobacteria bacterium]MBT6245470.1 hypothetical protein [Gammaproteobacteria bacterium]